MKREKINQQDATIRCLLLSSVSTCFGHHYAYLQENKDRVTAFGVLLWFCWMRLVAVVGRCVVGCEHCSHPTTQRLTSFSLHKDTTRHQPNHTVTPTHIKPEQYNTWNKSTISRKLLKMDVLTFETCWAANSEIIKQVTSSWSIFIQ